MPAEKTLIVNKILEQSVLINPLKDKFKIRFSTIEADIIVPGICTSAFLLIEETMLLPHHYEMTMARINKLKSAFKDSYLLFIVDTAYGEMKMNNMQISQQLPTVLSCTPGYLTEIMQIFAKVFTKEREKRRGYQTKLLEASYSGQDASLQVVASMMLPNDDSAGADDNQDVSTLMNRPLILQDCFGSIAQLAQLAPYQLTGLSPLDTTTAKYISTFFSEAPMSSRDELEDLSLDM